MKTAVEKDRQPVLSNTCWKQLEHWQVTVLGVGVIFLLFLAFFNLTKYPLTWFDEGSHLHVPKTLVNYGVYADFSSEGFRYYGPTAGIGPTVFLPIAGAFKLFGIGLFQARLVMVLYLLAAIYFFFRLARHYGDHLSEGGDVVFAMVVTALLVTSRGIDLLEYGRQVLGEVPGLVFLVAGLLVWYQSWEKPAVARLMAAGLLLGLSTVTKNQYLLVLAPALLLMWLANLIYYKAVAQRVFLVTGTVTALCYGVWQVYMVFFMGPASASENFALLQAGTAGAALVFSTELMSRGISELFSFKVFLGFLLPAVAYGFFLSLPRTKEGLRWGVIFALVLSNLAWYVLASISWNRYSFPGQVFSTLFVAKIFSDWTDGFKWEPAAILKGLRTGQKLAARAALSTVLLFWLALMIVIPLGQNVMSIVRPSFNAPEAMAAYMDQHVDKKALVETWEPEMGFLTHHNYHFPPPGLLYTAVSYIWMHKSPPANVYDFVQNQKPAYVLVGSFSSWVELYSPDLLKTYYSLETEIGAYRLYVRN